MALGNTVGFVYVQVFADTVNFGKQIDRDLDKSRGKFDRWTLRLRNSLRRMGTGGWFDTITNALAGVIRLGSGVADSFKTTFDFIGGMFEKVGGKIFNLGNQTDGVFGKIINPMLQQAGLSASRFGSSLAAFAGTPQGAVVAIALAVGAMQVVLSLAVTAVSALTAGVVALGSAIYYTLAGVLILVPALGAMGVGLAGAALGAWEAGKAIGAMYKYMNETDPKKKAEALKAYNKELAKLGPNSRAAVKAMEPLLKQFDGLKKAAGEAFFEGMADALNKSKPLIKAVEKGLVLVSGAMGDVVDRFLLLGRNEVFLRNFNKMWESSAKIIDSLGATAANLFEGFTNFFAAIAPLTEKFADNLAKATGSFADWAGSAEGQNSIAEFFQQAWDIASQMWAVLKEIGLTLHDLFTAEATVGAAEGFLGWILARIEEFHNWIITVSENGKLQEWFDSAKEIGLEFWEMLKAVGRFLKSLDSPENREWLVSLMRFIGMVVDAMNLMMRVGALVFNGLLGWVKPLISAMSTLVGWIKSAVSWFKRIVIPKLPSWLPGVSSSGGGGSWAAPSAQIIPFGAPANSSMVTNNWNITTPGMDARVVAAQVLNRSVAMAG